MERIEDKIKKNQTWMNENQLLKLEDYENQIWMNENQVWEPKNWEESNLDEWKIKIDNQKIVNAKLGWLGDQVQ